MKRTAILVSVLLVSLAACKKKEGDQPAEPSKPVEPAKPAEPFAGKLTIERVMAANNLVDPLTSWTAGLAKLKGQLGEPTRVKDGKYEWAIVEGDDCAYVYVTKEDGAKYQQTGEVVGQVMSPMKVGKTDLPMNRSQCLEITGVTAGPPEDPNAAGPPTDGTPVTVEAFRPAAIAGRSKWKAQRVAVAGLFVGSTTATSGADTFTTLTIKNAPDDAGKVVGCSLAKNATAPTFEAEAKVVATGTVKIQEWTSMGSGETTLEATLLDCTLEAAK